MYQKEIEDHVRNKDSESTPELWHADLLQRIERARNPATIFEAVGTAARSLGFEHCAFGIRLPFPLTRPKILQYSNQPADWQRRYTRAGYLHIDPTVQHGAVTEEPVLWSDLVFRQTPQLWHEAQSAGLRHGWAQSSLDGIGLGSMLTLSRSREPITATELQHNEPRMRLLVQIAHAAFSATLSPRPLRPQAVLTEREREVVRETADGNTVDEIADLLALSANTVKFHLKNAAAKLRVTNKTALVALALYLHQLD